MVSYIWHKQTNSRVSIICLVCSFSSEGLLSVANQIAYFWEAMEHSLMSKLSIDKDIRRWRFEFVGFGKLLTWKQQWINKPCYGFHWWTSTHLKGIMILQLISIISFSIMYYISACNYTRIFFLLLSFHTSSCLMHGTIKKVHIPKFQQLIYKGYMYVISDFKVMWSLGGYQVVNNPLKISLLIITKFSKVDPPIIIPKYGFQLADLKTLDERVNDSTFLMSMYPFDIIRIRIYACHWIMCMCKINIKWLWNVDVLRILVSVGEVEKVRVKRIKKKDMDLILFGQNLIPLLPSSFFSQL